MKQIGIAIIGCGGITLQNHLPGLALCPAAKITALCDADPTTLQHARRVQVVIDAALKSTETLQWVDVENSL